MTCVSENACSDDHTPLSTQTLVVSRDFIYSVVSLRFGMAFSESRSGHEIHISIPTSSSRRLDMSTHIPFSIFLYPFLNSYRKKAACIKTCTCIGW